MASITEEQALIDGYNLRSPEFPKGRDFYAMMASAAFKRDYWDCTEFRKPKKIEEFLELIPNSYFVELESGETKRVCDLVVGDRVKTDAGVQVIQKICRVDDKIRFE